MRSGRFQRAVFELRHYHSLLFTKACHTASGGTALLVGRKCAASPLQGHASCAGGGENLGGMVVNGSCGCSGTAPCLALRPRILAVSRNCGKPLLTRGKRSLSRVRGSAGGGADRG